MLSKLRRRIKKSRNDSGEMLLDATIAIAVVATIMSLLLVAIPLSHDATATSLNGDAAGNVADSVIEDARGLPFAVLNTYEAPEPENATVDAEKGLPESKVVTVRNVPLHVSTTVSDKDVLNPSAPRTVTVKVEWRNSKAGLLHSTTQSALISPNIGDVAPAGTQKDANS